MQGVVGVRPGRGESRGSVAAGRPPLDPRAVPGEHSPVIHARIPASLAVRLNAVRLRDEAAGRGPVSLSDIVREALSLWVTAKEKDGHHVERRHSF